jgi:hypothetical protein
MAMIMKLELVLIIINPLLPQQPHQLPRRAELGAHGYGSAAMDLDFFCGVETIMGFNLLKAPHYAAKVIAHRL